MGFYLVREYKRIRRSLHGDIKVRQYLTKELKNASVSKITIERPAKSIKVTIHTARPGVVIGKKGADVEKLRNVVAKLTGVPGKSTSQRSASLS